MVKKYLVPDAHWDASGIVIDYVKYNLNKEDKYDI